MAGQNGGNPEQALVIGAGVAGLSCGLRLQKAGIPFTILESSDGPGGRVRSDKVEGFTLDRGFQIFLTSYPEAKEVLDYADLDLKPFYAGAFVHYNNQFHKVADPLRHPLDGVQSLFNSTGTIGDKVNVGAFRIKSELGSLQDLLQRDETTTLERLKKEGFTDAIIDRFFKPFLGGIFFDKELNVTSRLFEFVMRMLASGENSLPANGIGAISEQMAAALPAGSIKTGAKVKEVTSSDTESPPEVTLEDGSKMTAKRGIVVATDQPSAAKLLGHHLDSSPSKEGKGRGTCNLYFKTSQKPPHGNVLYLNGTGSGLVNNACFPSSVAPSYAPSGQHLVSVSIIGSHDDMTDDALSSAVHQEMSQWFGAKQTDDWKLLRVYRVPFAQPNQEPPTDLMRPVQLGGRLYVCGDHRDHATLDGALKSGRRAAEALIADTVQETTSNGAPSEPMTVDQTELA
ncbi:hypothetical protein WJX77_000310 [Trebouxia sp. C0004]